MTRVVIAPLVARTQREAEYRADSAVAKAGYGAALALALEKLSYFEAGRTGWEAAITATHPPIELRIEALVPAVGDEKQLSMTGHRTLSLPEVSTVLLIIFLLLVVVIVYFGAADRVSWLPHPPKLR
jgi:hypothetical protein